MMYYQKTTIGFSLVETLVAISILLIVITGPMSIAMRTAKSSSFASEQIQAFFLAQEGLELAQKARDEYLLDYFDDGIPANPWAEFTTVAAYQNCFDADGCGLEWNSAVSGALITPARSCDPITNCLLYRASSGRSWFTYISAGASPTVFTRKITFTDDGGNDDVKVKSTVTWRTGSLVAEQKVEVDTYLYNIYGN
jgi:Tfp pilus assembly protein PilV